MEFHSFESRFPDIAGTETRCLTFYNGDLGVPKGTYAFIESFCNDETCECHRAFINIYCVEGELDRKHLATIGFGWESVDFYTEWFYGDKKEGKGLAGTRVEPFQRQSPYSDFFLQQFNELLKDKSYRNRIIRHYEIFRSKTL